MKRIAFFAAVVAALLGSAPEARAQAVPLCAATAPCDFTTVDSVRATANNLYVTGILEAQATATERRVAFSTSAIGGIDLLASCQRLAMLAMARPGQFVLRMAMPADAYSFTTCQLTRVTP